MRKLIFVLAGFFTFFFGVVSFNFAMILSDFRILLEPARVFRADTFNIAVPELPPALVPVVDENADYSFYTCTFPESGYYAIKNTAKAFRGFEFNLGYELSPPNSAQEHSLWVNDRRRGFIDEGNVVKIDGKKIFFKTAEIDGIKYIFEGNFTGHSFSIEDYQYEYNAEAVLRGTLTKFLNGKKVAEAPVEFFYNGLGC